MKPYARAALQGIRFQAAWRMCKARTLPAPSGQKGDLDRQLSRLEWAPQASIGQESGAKALDAIDE